MFTSSKDNKIIHEFLYIVKLERSPKLSWREWFGFRKSRDAPDTELPKIEDKSRVLFYVSFPLLCGRREKSMGYTNSGLVRGESNEVEIADVNVCRLH